MPEQKRYTFSTEVEGLSVSVVEVLPDGQPKAAIQLVHGMCEHKERYIPFMEYLAGKGYLCVIHDQRGHGESVISQEDLGYMYGEGSEGLLADILTVNHKIREEYPDIPLVLFGHSMGSLEVRAYAAQYDETIDMLIVCGTPAKNGARGIGSALAKIEGKLRGSRHKSKLLEGISLGAYSKKFAAEGSPVAWLSTNKENVKAYEDSELCGFTFTDDAFEVLFDMMKRAYDTGHWKCTRPEMPVLLISGQNDPCMVNIRKFAQAVQAMRKAGYQDVRGRIYRDMRHEILNETEKERVWKDVDHYIRTKLLNKSTEQEVTE